MAKVVSQKREMQAQDTRPDPDSEPRATPAVAAVGYFLVALFIVGAIAMVVMAFNGRVA